MTAVPQLNKIDGRYDVLKTLGDGFSGEVMLVSDAEGRKALKFLKKVQLNVSREDALANFKNEFEILKELNHPNIARILDFGCDARSQKYYFTSEFVSGTTFDKACEGQSVDVMERLIVQVLRALNYLHSRGTYHFDIKPQNILVEMKDGVPIQAKIIDFGLAGYSSPRKRVGTPAYMAPEVVQGGRLDGRTDLYSMGVVIYKLLTGVNPFAAKGLKETLENHVHFQPKPPSSLHPDLPEYWDHVVMRLLEKNPANRYSQAALAIRDLNFLSRKTFEIETSDTKLSYLPEKGALIGREEEWKLFTDVFGQAFLSDQISERRIVIVEGAKGTGKTRIFSEIKYFSQLRNVPVKTLPQWRTEESEPYQFIIAIEEGLQNTDEVNALLQELSSKRCLVVWATEKAPQGWGNAVVLGLKNYTEPQLKKYVEAVTGIPDVPTHWIERIYERTQGNPLLVTEVIKALLSQDFMCDASGKWDAATFNDVKLDFDRLKIPESVEDYLLSRFCDLPPAQKEILTLLAVHDAELDLERLGKLIGGAGDGDKTMHANLLALVHGDFLRKTSREPVYFFSNLLYGSVIYKALSTREKQKRHAKLAEVFAGDAANRQAYLRHVGNSTDRARAMEALVELGEWYRRNSDYAPAIQALERALVLLSTDQEEERFQVLLKLAEVYGCAQMFDKALDTSSKLATYRDEKAPDLIDEDLFAIHKRVVHSCLSLGRMDEAEAAIRRAQGVFSSHPNRVWTMTFLNQLGGIKFRRGEVDEAERIFLETHADWKVVLDDRQKAEIKNNRIIDVYLFKKKFHKAIEISRQSIAVIEKSGDYAQLANLYYGLGDVYYRLTAEGEDGLKEDFSGKCMESFLKCEEIARQHDDKQNLFKAFNGMGNMSYERRELEQALQYYKRALAVARGFHDLTVAAAIALNIGRCHKDLGQWNDAYSYLVYAQNTFESVEIRSTVSWQHFMMCCKSVAEVHCHRRHFDKAHAMLDRIDIMIKEHGFLSAYRFGRHFARLKVYFEEEKDVEFARELELARELATAVNDREDLEKYLESIGYVDAKPAEEAVLAQSVGVSSVTVKSAGTKATAAKGGIKMLTEQQGARQGADDLQKIIEINTFLNSERDVNRLLSLVLKYALQLSKAELGFVILIDEAGLPAVASSMNATESDQEKVSMSIVKMALENGEIVASSDAVEDERFDEAESVVLNELKSVLCLPIRSQNKPVGVFYLDNHFHANVFENCNVSLLKAFCDQVGIAIENARLFEKLDVAQRRLEDKLHQTEEELAEVKSLLIEESGVFKSKYSYNNIISKSKEMQNVFRLLDKVTETALSVFLYGESGTGKELVAKALHYNNPVRGKKRFVAINCGAIPLNLMESELFGHKAGSFTGAVRDKKGMFEDANGGTLFLDEIGELPMELQVKLLRVLQEGEVQRIGDNHVTKVDVRVVSASLKDIEIMVKSGKFREDLYYRLCQMRINLPALRSRKDDIPTLAKHFVKQHCVQNKIEKTIEIPPEFMKALLEYDWPGNIRELENLIYVACALQEKGELHMENLPDHYGIKKTHGGARADASSRMEGVKTAQHLADSGASVSDVKIDASNYYDPSKSWRDYEATIIAKCYEYHDRKKKPVADGLQLSHSTVYKKIEELNLDDTSNPLYAENFSYDGASSMKDFVQMVFQAALKHHDGHPYAAIRQLSVSQGYFYKIIKQGKAAEEGESVPAEAAEPS
jgi:transcriptional regulator with GAF, ATPase, and Fis domain/serine/threonine protein kinase/tetratricopeptide (TPR) repeat protein